MGRVFVLESIDDKRHISLNEARDFGEIVYVFKKDSDRSSIWSEDFKHEIIDKFQEEQFNPDKDYFCIVGYFVPVIMAVAELIVHYGEVRVLFFSAVNQHYLPRKLGENYEEEITKVGEDGCSVSSRVASRIRRSEE